MDSAFKKHGQVFTVPLFHKRVTFLLGPEVSTHFYKVRHVYSQYNVERGLKDNPARRDGTRQLRALGCEPCAASHGRVAFTHAHGRCKHMLRYSCALSHPQLRFSAPFALHPPTPPAHCPYVLLHSEQGTDLQVSQKEVYQFNVPTFGKGVVFDVDHTERAEQFRFFSEALKTARLQTYAQLMVQEAEAFFAKRLAADTGVVDLRELLSDLIILTASRTLMGAEVREKLFEKVSDLFHDLDMGMQPISVIFPHLPIAAHRKRDASRKELAKIFSGIITARKKSGIKGQDVLQSFIDARYKDGRALTDDQITGMLIAVLFAGQHTSSITSTWTGLFLMSNRGWWDKCEAEQKAVRAKHGDGLSYEVMTQMDTLHLCIKEALRLHPPLIMLMRLAKEAFTVTDKDGKQYTIPKGDILATSPTYSHRLEHVWKQPTVYDPARHLEGSGQGQLPFSFIGFGGGRHGCMGETFAYLQIKTIWSYLLRNFDFELVDAFPEPDYDSMVVGPKPPCRVRYTRRKL